MNMSTEKQSSSTGDMEAAVYGAIERIAGSPTRDILICLTEEPEMMTIYQLHTSLIEKGTTITQSTIAKEAEWLYEWGALDRVQLERAAEADRTADTEAPGGTIDTYWSLTDTGVLLAQEL